MTKLKVFDDVFKAHRDIKYVLHSAAPIVFQKEDTDRDILDTMINGILAILYGAQKYGANFKKIVYSSNAEVSR